MRGQPPNVAAAAFVKSCNFRIRPAGHPAPARRRLRWRAGLDSPAPKLRCKWRNQPSGPIGQRHCVSIGQRTVPRLTNEREIAATINGGDTMRPYLVGSLKGPDLANNAETTSSDTSSAARCHRRSPPKLTSGRRQSPMKGAIPGVQIASRRAPPSSTDPRHLQRYQPLRPHKPKLLVENGADKHAATGGASGTDRAGVIEAALQGAPGPRVGVTLSGEYAAPHRHRWYGPVWEAVDNRLGRRVAVSAQSGFSIGFIERFRARSAPRC